ncbi:MAG: DUF349 domain-containing protein [Clostridiales bacterium]|nr:DUF349 domain-containing protein [Clostridiales bacterium]
MEMQEESKLKPQTELDLTLNPELPVASDVLPDTTTIEQPEADEVEDTEAMVGDEENSRQRTVYGSIEELLDALRGMAARQSDDIAREELASVKQQFYAFQHKLNEETLDGETELAEKKDAPNEATPAETEFKALMNVIKEKKAARMAEIESLRADNLKKRDEIIEQLLAMSADADNVNREFPRFRELQQQFKEVGEVTASESTAQWKRYQDAVEKFYDQYRINKDLRDYDFRKNLDVKTLLCNEAESLAVEEDVVVAFKRLQALHDTWRDTGPVAKEVREEIWNRFKDASAVVNKRYQAFFEERKAREMRNEEAKTALCERAEAIDYVSASSYKDWDELTDKILALQEEWRSLGYATRRNNNKLFARFRAACDAFFSAKALYFKSARDQQTQNLQLKTSLCEQAEELSDSTDWKKTADKLIDLQRRWKEIGPIPRKQSEALWTRFQKACDHFFEMKKKDLSESRKSEQAALRAKREIIAELKAVDDDVTPDDVQAALHDADTRWRQAGHVPFREKDKIYEEYRGVVNELRNRFKLSRSSRSMARFETELANMGNDSNRISRERERLARIYEAKCQELKTCENNLGFFTAKNARGNAMLQELDRRISTVKEDIQTLRDKIALLDKNSL